MNFWLMKSEPTTFSVDDFAKVPHQISPWEGVRNYQARNYMRAMTVGDQAFFYHSSCPAPGIMGIMQVVKAAYPDETAWDPTSPYFDPRSTRENPRWDRVDVQLISRFTQSILLKTLHTLASELGEFPLLQRGNRLSVLPVTEAQWKRILPMT
jgi:predicted RNA-binding protein with PUA-like domain